MIVRPVFERRADTGKDRRRPLQFMTGGGNGWAVSLRFRLSALRGSGESYPDVILRLVERP